MSVSEYIVKGPIANRQMLQAMLVIMAPRRSVPLGDIQELDMVVMAAS